MKDSDHRRFVQLPSCSRLLCHSLSMSRPFLSKSSRGSGSKFISFGVEFRPGSRPDAWHWAGRAQIQNSRSLAAQADIITDPISSTFASTYRRPCALRGGGIFHGDFTLSANRLKTASGLYQESTEKRSESACRLRQHGKSFP